MPDLSDEAKAQIKEAIRIVREDRHYKMLSEIHGRTVPPPTPSKDPNNPDPPPPTAESGTPPTDPPGDKKVGLWWGRDDLYPTEPGAEPK